jgi:hypothetical protein
MEIGIMGRPLTCTMQLSIELGGYYSGLMEYSMTNQLGPQARASLAA